MSRRNMLVFVLVAAGAAGCAAAATGSSAPGSPAASDGLQSAVPGATPTADSGGSTAPTPSATLSATPGPSVATAPPTAPASNPPSGGPSWISGITDLRQLLPDQIGGVTMTKSLFTGNDFAANPAAVSEQLRSLLQGLDRGVIDLTMAVATDPSATIDITVTAFRVQGVPAHGFLAAYLPLISEAFPDSTVNESLLGTKSVYDVSLDGKGAGTTFLYPREDVLFIVTGTDRDLASEAFRSLP